MGETKRHHYVPRLYLKRFSFDGKLLHTFIIPSSKKVDDIDLSKLHRDISIEDVCVSKDFYRISPELAHVDINPLELEKKFFQDYAEPHLKETIDTLDDLAKTFLKNDHDIADVNITPELFFRVVQAAFVQYYRATRSRNTIDEVNDIMKIVLKENYERKGITVDENKLGMDVPYTHADKTYMNYFLFKQFLQKISGYSMMLRVSKNSNFFTSDNPVVIYKIGAKGQGVFNVNFYQDEFILFYPLTPYLILEFYNTKAFPETKELNKTITVVPKEYEEQVNRYQYTNAKKFVFSYKDDFSLFLRNNK